MSSIRTFEHKGVQYRIPESLKNGRYRVTGVLARGGFGIIYTGLDTQLYNKKVLIKSIIYKPSLFQHKNDVARQEEINECRELMRREKVTLQYLWERKIGSVPILLDEFRDFNPMLHGPHRDEATGELYTCDEFSSDDPFLVLSYFDGFSVGDHKNSDKSHLSRFAKKILVSIGKILEELHKDYNMQLNNGENIVLQCIYCDMKPANLIYTTDKSVVLIDLGGVVKKVDGELNDSIISTPGYCAPEINEQLQKNILPEDVTPAVDVYSLGATLYEILAQQPPVVQENRNIFDFSLIEEDFPQWVPFLQKCLQEFPQDRYLTIREMIQGYYNVVENKPPRENWTNAGNKRNVCTPLRNPTFVFPGWETVQENTHGMFEIYELQRQEEHFYLNAQGLHIHADHLLQKLQLSGIEKEIFFPSLKLHFEQIVKFLCMNKLYLPELLNASFMDDQFYIIYKVKKGKKVRYEFKFTNQRDEFLYKRISKLINMFLDMEKSGIILSQILWEDISFDTADNPFLTTIHYLRQQENSFQAFPEFLLRMTWNFFSAPEIISKNHFNKKTYSYFIGQLLFKVMLYSLQNENLKRAYESNVFPDKTMLETWIPQVTADPVLQKFLLHSLLLDPQLRASPEELRSILASSDNSSNNTTTSSRQLHSNVIILTYDYLDMVKINKSANSFFHKNYYYYYIFFRVKQPQKTSSKQVIVTRNFPEELDNVLQNLSQNSISHIVIVADEKYFPIIERWANHFEKILVLTNSFNYRFLNLNIYAWSLSEFIKKQV